MGYYYKLLDLIEGKYTTHETLEEVHHYINHRVSDMQYNYKFTDKLICTPHSNYDFHYVIVEDDCEFREFVYFFDTIEEELDSRDDDRDDDRDEMREQRDRAINLLNEKTTALFEANRTIDFLRKRIYDLETDDSERSETIESLRNRVLVLEAGIKESERNEQFWKSQYEKYKKFVDGMHKQSADFMYGCDDDFPF